MDFVFEIVGWRSKAGSDLNGSFDFDFDLLL